MKKRVILISIILLTLFLSIILAASSINTEMQKITHYAEQYEIGNIVSSTTSRSNPSSS